jgi:hypothetical protein
MRRRSPKPCSVRPALRCHQDRRAARSAGLASGALTLVGERTAIGNEIRAFLLDRGIAVALAGTGARLGADAVR